MRVTAGIDRVGSVALTAYSHTRGTLDLLGSSLREARALMIRPMREVLLRQVYFTGVETALRLGFTGVLLGVVIITQVSSIVGVNAVLIGKVLLWTVVREMGPVFTAIFVIARSSTAVASELGSMQVSGEVDALRSMGIEPLRYLILPRIAGVTLSVFVLTFYFQAAAIVGGLVVSSLLLGANFMGSMPAIFAALGLFEVGISLLKGLFFGLAISASSCYHGLRVRGSITEIPQATTFAVMQSLTLVVLIDGIVTVAAFI